LVLVFAAYLEEIKEVCGGSMDGNQVLIRLGSWVGQISDMQVLRTLVDGLVVELVGVFGVVMP
jgi:hypothetical protein